MTDKGRDYYMPMPLDFAVLERLPDKGILGGVHWAGRPVKHLVDEINQAAGAEGAHVDNNMVTSRLRSMKIAGLVEVFPATGARIWARTTAGRELLGRREEVLGL